MDCTETPTTASDRLKSAAECRSGQSVVRWIAVFAAVGLLTYGGFRIYWGYTANWGTVVPGKIYRSATISRHMVREKLTDHHIAVIVFLSKDTGDDPDLTEERAAAKAMGVEFLNFPMNGDGVAEPSQYPAALEAVYHAAQGGKPVLIHCHSGAQRTGGVVAMYRILIEGKPMKEAYAELSHYGFDPARNPTLLPFLNEHMTEWGQKLAADKIIPRAPESLPKLAP